MGTTMGAFLFPHPKSDRKKAKITIKKWAPNKRWGIMERGGERERERKGCTAFLTIEQERKWGCYYQGYLEHLSFAEMEKKADSFHLFLLLTLWLSTHSPTTTTHCI